MSNDASELIKQQFKDGGVVPGQLPGQNAVSKTYVDTELEELKEYVDQKNATLKGFSQINGIQASTLNDSLTISTQSPIRVTNNNATKNIDLSFDAQSINGIPAQNVTYTGSVTGATNAKSAIDSLRNTLDQVVAAGETGSSGPEVAAARYSTPYNKTYSSLQARLDATDQAVINSPVFNVKAYGAKGDGVTDDSPAIQAAVNDLIQAVSNGDTLYSLFFPAGRYLMNSRVSLTLPGTLSTKLYNGISIYGIGNNGSKLIAGANNADGLFKITMPTYKHFVWVRDINFVSNLDQNTGVSKNNGIGLWITSPNDPGKVTPGLNSDYTVIVEDCHWHSDKVDEGDAQSRSGVWYRCLQIDFAYVPIVQRCQFRSPLDSASPTYTGSNHDAAIHMQHCYAPDIRHNTIDGYYAAACRNIGTVTSTSQASGSWEGGFFVNNLVANALDGLVITHAFTSEPNLYEPGFHLLGNHINVRRFGTRIKYHGLIVISDNYCFVAPSQPGTETLPAVFYLEQATTVNIHGNQFDSTGFYNSDTNASVAIRIDGYSSGIFINGNQFNHGGVSIYNNNVQSTNTTDTPRSIISSNNAWIGKKNSSWAQNVKYVDLTRNMLIWEPTQNANQDQMEFTSRTTNASNSPKLVLKRLRSDYATNKTDVPLTAIGAIGLNDQGGEKEFAKIRMEATNNSNGAERGSIVFTILVNGSEQQIMKMNGFNGALETAKMIVSGSVKVANYTKSTLPPANSEGAGAMIYVSDDAGGSVIAFSDGTNWRRVTDRNIVS
ncbi:glycosyl hydrolase family 28-related protein [Paenibacillus kandeliae]|uniref:glycosyl hydrolase family 28-related protein n=1 Tax=Paenibacillus kandeliae TaxID=3231269 RepID=UPI003458EB26